MILHFSLYRHSHCSHTNMFWVTYPNSSSDSNADQPKKKFSKRMFLTLRAFKLFYPLKLLYVFDRHYTNIQHCWQFHCCLVYKDSLSVFICTILTRRTLFKKRYSNKFMTCLSCLVFVYFLQEYIIKKFETNFALM